MNRGRGNVPGKKNFPDAKGESGKGTFQEGQMDIPPSESGSWRCDETINMDIWTGLLGQWAAGLPVLPSTCLIACWSVLRAAFAEPTGVTSSVHRTKGAVFTGRTERLTSHTTDGLGGQRPPCCSWPASIMCQHPGH